MWLDVLSRSQAAFESAHAREGFRSSDSLPDVGAAALALARTARNAGVSESASCVIKSVRRILRPSRRSDVRMRFTLPKFACALSRAAAPRGFQMCSDPVAVIPAGRGELCARLASSQVGVWDFKVKCGEGSRKGGFAVCKLKFVKAICGATQTAFRIPDLGFSVLRASGVCPRSLPRSLAPRESVARGSVAGRESRVAVSAVGRIVRASGRAIWRAPPTVVGPGTFRDAPCSQRSVARLAPREASSCRAR